MPLAEAAVNKNLKMLHLLLEYSGEDKHHDALKVCLPTTQSEMIVPLLSSLIKCDKAYKHSKQPTTMPLTSVSYRGGLFIWQCGMSAMD